MRLGRFQFVAMLALLAGLCVQPALAQRGARQGKGKGEQAGKQVRPGPGKGPGARGAVPQQWVERLRAMPPEQQERFFRNNWRFQNLPPEEQARLRENLRRWNSLSPQEKREFQRREEIWRRMARNMTAEERQRFREEILPRWQRLSPERRHAIQRRLAALSRMSDDERARLLNDAQFLEGLSTEERDLLREMSTLRLPSPGQAPPDQDVIPPL